MNQRKNHWTDIIFVLSLFCVFTVLALFVVILGVDVYKSISTNMDTNYNMRTSISYMTEKIRQSDAQGEISLEKVGGSDALVLTERVGEGEYETWIYEDNGDLREVMVQKGVEVHAGDGQALMQVGEIHLEYKGDDLLEISVTDDGGTTADNVVRVIGERGEQ